ncbi:MAG: hypothetical protein QOG54_525 [Actinomycetota bacterium]|jgi:hypothetical protein|nr:hypothetical protein [Actinomycetota bacterium]
MSEEIAGWFAGRLPDDWFEEAPEVRVDREEILVIGRIPDVELDGDSSPEALEAARVARIERFRADTRGQRMEIADEAQHKFRKKVSWGTRCGELSLGFTTLAAPVMTRLRQKERKVLDTLVDAGVARSRSHALAWCVRLVAENEKDWIGKLREALKSVEKVRAEGPA